MSLTKKKFSVLLFDMVLLLVLVGIDQYTKRLAVLHLKDQTAIPIIEGVFELRYLENRGAAFGMLQDQRIFFLLSTTIILCVIAYIIFKMPLQKRFYILQIFMVVISAGAIGNLIDRVTLFYVVDFLYFSLIDFPIFNVADMYVTVSCTILALLYLFYYKEEDFKFIMTSKKKDI